MAQRWRRFMNEISKYVHSLFNDTYQITNSQQFDYCCVGIHYKIFNTPHTFGCDADGVDDFWAAPDNAFIYFVQRVHFCTYILYTFCKCNLRAKRLGSLACSCCEMIEVKLRSIGRHHLARVCVLRPCVFLDSLDIAFVRALCIIACMCVCVVCKPFQLHAARAQTLQEQYVLLLLPLRCSTTTL